MVKRKANDIDYEADIVVNAPPRRTLRPRGRLPAPPAQENTSFEANIGFLTLHLSPGFDVSKLKNKKYKAKKPVYRRPALPKRKKPYTNRYRFEFGEDRLYTHLKPTLADLGIVGDILKHERPAMKIAAEATGNASTPFHAGGRISLDSIVRVILSQSCTNEAALDAQQTMIVAYPFYVDGKAVVGKMPNYHDMRKQSVDKLKAVFTKTGLQNLKGNGIKAVLDAVYETNVTRIKPGEVIYDGNEHGATDFVPGLLSVDYIYEAYEKGGKQAVFDQLVLLPQVGVKSACCLMGFNMNLPVFAVDTHVAGMAKLLG
ncbi:hypothetical protein A1O1_00047 [Capronia coronata CBS 617.96]|uniref:HhH-GPD domain-containing protein n=1 Tax=Capronia coronata CBS 617.96 TaxID=1182541 RepID=W9ZKA6_9EURO|nr:uncharacterized protein A1O1_00047 [Capronia coronata CBS 617.96]EXJ94929.1 hypothetical protein A1O1_00047 [Capronia coronata CBS 617.96]